MLNNDLLNKLLEVDTFEEHYPYSRPIKQLDILYNDVLFVFTEVYGVTGKKDGEIQFYYNLTKGDEVDTFNTHSCSISDIVAVYV